MMCPFLSRKKAAPLWTASAKDVIFDVVMNSTDSARALALAQSLLGLFDLFHGGASFKS